MKFAVVALAAGASGLLVLPGEANACTPKECSGAGGFSEFSLSHDTVPTDGVLVFRTQRWSSDLVADEETLEHITVVVADAQGSQLDGALELSGPVFLWRPAAGLGPGELTVSVSIDNPAIQNGEGPACDFEDVQFTVTGVGQAPPFEALERLEFGFATDYEYLPSTDLSTYVCCDGAYPAEDYGGCGGEPPTYSEGYCVASRGRAFATADYDASALSGLAEMVRVEILADGEPIGAGLGIDFAESGMSRRLDRAFDAALRITSLIDGREYLSEPGLADGGFPDALGEIESTISSELQENCETPAYTCDSYPPDSTEPPGWDPDACEPVDDEGGDTDDPSEGGSGGQTEGDSMTGGESEGDTESGDADAGDTEAGPSGGEADGDEAGCGCTSGSDAPWGAAWLVVVAAGLLRRRRRT